MHTLLKRLTLSHSFMLPQSEVCWTAAEPPCNLTILFDVNVFMHLLGSGDERHHVSLLLELIFFNEEHLKSFRKKHVE